MWWRLAWSYPSSVQQNQNRIKSDCEFTSSWVHMWGIRLADYRLTSQKHDFKHSNWEHHPRQRCSFEVCSGWATRCIVFRPIFPNARWAFTDYDLFVYGLQHRWRWSKMDRNQNSCWGCKTRLRLHGRLLKRPNLTNRCSNKWRRQNQRIGYRALVVTCGRRARAVKNWCFK